MCHLLSCPARGESGGAEAESYSYTHSESKLILHPPSRSSNTCPQFQQDFNLTTDATGVFNSTLTRDIAVPVNATADELDNIPVSEVQGFKEPALPWYSDQALPFDITVAAANEYGAAASAKLFGVEILNEGFGSSVDDSVLEMQATFVARSVGFLARNELVLLTARNSVVNTWPHARAGHVASIPNRCHPDLRRRSQPARRQRFAPVKRVGTLPGRLEGHRVSQDRLRQP